MFGFNKIPSVSVQDVAKKLQGDDDYFLIDVRELLELQKVNLGEAALHVPLSQLAQQGISALPTTIQENKNAEIIVMCHHGNRSAQVTSWLRQQGWKNVWNMTGGIDAYATAVDPTIGRY